MLASEQALRLAGYWLSRLLVIVQIVTVFTVYIYKSISISVSVHSFLVSLAAVVITAGTAPTVTQAATQGGGD